MPQEHDEWLEGRRYLGLDVLARARLTLLPDTGTADSSDVASNNDLQALRA